MLIFCLDKRLKEMAESANDNAALLTQINDLKDTIDSLKQKNVCAVKVLWPSSFVLIQCLFEYFNRTMTRLA